MLRRVTKKTLAVFLIFVLTIADFALVTKSYASTIFGSVFSNKNADSQNVEFDAYFMDAEKEKSYSAISRVCDNVSLYLGVSVSDEGYLKNSSIKIKPRDNDKLNFKVNSKVDEIYLNYIKEFKNNCLELKQINRNSGITVPLVLGYEQEEFIKPDKMYKNFLVEFNGTYITENGQEIKIQKEIALNLEWQDFRELEIESSAFKYVPYNIEGNERRSSSNTC